MSKFPMLERELVMPGMAVEGLRAGAEVLLKIVPVLL